MIPTRVRLRRATAARTLFAPTALPDALTRLGFVQADPIRAPARAQDLTLRHRVSGYRAGDLERSYPGLDLEEGFFVNYGFVPRDIHALMHPRGRLGPWPAPGRRTSDAVLAFVLARGRAHPREVDAHFAHGSVTNYWGGSSSATTHLLEHLHYRGLLRVAGREGGIRIYAPPVPAVPATGAPESRARLDALVDVLVRTYAPLPSATLSWLLNRLRLGVPQWEADIRPALARAKRRLAHARVEGIDWYWPGDEPLAMREVDDTVRLLAPFDPIVWDRRRFSVLWGWDYRFEAYTPAPQRKFGYYALPVLWRDRVVGWANLSLKGDRLQAALGYVAGHVPRGRVFARALDEELARVQWFLRLGP
ncbi:MAG: YcaQ family DNA glycosylase [Acidobacteria bacterium]|nr:YcaQ family DNA glycosylase [Acidobacteriota bacterium]